VIAKNIYVFTDIDLDGSTSLLVLHWSLGAKLGELKYKATTVSNLRRELLRWLEEDSFSNYDEVYFLDLDTSNCNDLIDKSNVNIIDHHLTHVQAVQKGVYKNATVNVVENTSCAKQLYKYFKIVIPGFETTLSAEQKILIALADDYDSYQLKLEDSYNLNCLLINTQKTLDKTRVDKFAERFYVGFKGFNQQEKNIIKEYITGRDLAIKNLQIYTGSINISKQNLIVTGSMGTKYVNDVCDYLLKNYNSDIVFFVNTNSSHVSFRKKKECTVNMSKLANKLCEGGGHEYAAGGKITDTFMEFVKQLTLMEKL
jgi:oligoribonuclease NrnB/cAMP/cGMP phosphodiesterase (DHH superfamily)